ncbi:hypothetical protein ACQ33O_08040 [Ferruginibacter sp. SUN002]|uniref:hypothetical protein n=1 Tax=Ferruginibacter sp. SUN002 TaxID=2937789 RepID=UPI003D359BCC
MRKNLLLLFTFFTLIQSSKADYGIWASGIYLKVNANPFEFYSTLLQNNPNSIGSVNFGGDLGAFQQNSGTLVIGGAEIKTFRNGGNVCGGVLRYTIYPRGARPVSPVFSPINLNFFCDCSGGTFCGGGTCTDGVDQKWQTVGQNIDLTQTTQGLYTLEIYYECSGASSGGGCAETNYDGNSGNNYKADFEIAAVAPVNFSGLSASVINSSVQLKWSIQNDEDVASYEIERSTDGINFSSLKTVASLKSNLLHNYFSSDFDLLQGNVYYRLKLHKIDNSVIYSKICRIDLSKPADHLVVLSNQATGVVGLRLNTLPKGKYDLWIFNNTGQRMASYPLTHDGIDKIVPINTSLNKGVYRLVLSNGRENFKTSFLVK